MRTLNLLAGGVALLGAAALFSPGPASATYRPDPVVEELLGYCCTTQGMRCCSRNGCEISGGECKRL
jgi:hypothetical protein